MGYTATVIEIMIASPSDVSKERNIIRDVISDWNVTNARDRNVVLLPLSWETHTSPEMRDRPQEIINRQLLYDADLLVAVFWTRLGSPTGVAPSGTVEEIEKHLKADKPAMIYFSSVPVHPDSIDNEQYSALKAFKESCKQKGLIEEYETPEQFKDKFSRQLAQTVIHHFTNPSADSSGISQSPEQEVAPSLSDPARELLREAIQTQQGVICRIGNQVQTNGRQFAESGDSRSVARWRSAVDELNNLDLIEDFGERTGEIFRVTDKGYRIANSPD